MSEVVQHVVVTMAALAAVAFIVRRVLTAVGSGDERQSPCASCPAARHGITESSPMVHAASDERHPLVIHKRRAPFS